MGLHVSSLARLKKIPEASLGVDYFVYFLNYYQFDNEIVDAFLANKTRLETHFSRLGNALLVTSVGNVDFYDEVISWHGVCGVDPETFGPAFL